MYINSDNVPAAGCGRPSYGHLLVIGGAEDRAGGSGLLPTFVALTGGACARIVLVTSASGAPSLSFAHYSAVCHRLGVPVVRELRLASREQADGEQARTELAWATGVFFSGGDQSRVGPLVGSRANQILRGRLADGTLVVAGTSAGATALGETMILGGGCRAADKDGRLRTGPGLGLLPEVIIDMHFAERRRFPRLLEAVLRQPAHLGVGIDEDTAILVRSGRFGVLGRGAVVTIDARPALAIGAVRGHTGQACPGVRLHQLHAGDAFDMGCRTPTAERFKDE